MEENAMKLSDEKKSDEFVQRDTSDFVLGKRKMSLSRFKIIPEHNEKDLDDGSKEYDTVERKLKPLRGPDSCTKVLQPGLSRGPDSCTKVLQQGTERPGLSSKRIFTRRSDFCRKVQKKLEADDYERFLKGLSIYSEEIITKTQLTDSVRDMLEKHPDLMDEFNGFLEHCESIGGSFDNSVPIEDRFWTREILDRTPKVGRRYGRKLQVRNMLEKHPDLMDEFNGFLEHCESIGGSLDNSVPIEDRFRTREIRDRTPKLGRRGRALQFPSESEILVHREELRKRIARKKNMLRDKESEI